jgi:hypothetical protein
MRPLAHHAGEDSLVNLLLVGSSWLSAAAVVGRARLAAARNRLERLRRRWVSSGVSGRAVVSSRASLATRSGAWRASSKQM